MLVNFLTNDLIFCLLRNIIQLHIFYVIFQISNISGLSEPTSDRLSLSGISLNSNQTSPRVTKPITNNPISNDLSMLRSREKKRSKQGMYNILFIMQVLLLFSVW